MPNMAGCRNKGVCLPTAGMPSEERYMTPQSRPMIRRIKITHLSSGSPFWTKMGIRRHAQGKEKERNFFGRRYRSRRTIGTIIPWRKSGVPPGRRTVTGSLMMNIRSTTGVLREQDPSLNLRSTRVLLQDRWRQGASHRNGVR